MTQSKGRSDFQLEKRPKLALSTVQVDRTPDQPSIRTVASIKWPRDSHSEPSSDKAPVHCSTVPSTMQKEDFQDPQAELQSLAKSIKGEKTEDLFHSSSSARPVSRTGSTLPRQSSSSGQPRKRLKIRGDFAFASTYDSPETVNRVARQNRREFLTSYITTKDDLQRATSRASTSSMERSLLERFMEQYPSYAGDDKHFGIMCSRIEALYTQDRMEHPSLWDDYIIRSQDEYRKYLLKCAENVEDPLPFDRFYQKEISKPLYTKSVVTPETLKEALSFQNEKQTVTVSDRRSSASTPQAAEPIAATGGESIAASVTKHKLDNNGEGNQRSEGNRDHKSRQSLPWQQRVATAIDLTQTKISNEYHAPSVEWPQLPILPTTRQGIMTEQSHAISPQADRRLFEVSTSPELKRQIPVAIEGDNKDSAFVPAEATEWWQDRNTPFKEFVRADLAIRSGKGNAFAKFSTSTIEKGNGERKKVREPKKWMDVLSWTLD